MNRFIVLLFFYLSILSSNVFAEVVLSDDGREVRLNDNGSWEFVSEDRYATTGEGERIRLKADGTWEFVAQDSEWAEAPAVARSREDVVRHGDVRIELSGWRIESARDKRKKNTTLRSQMVLELTIKSDGEIQKPTGRQLEISDSRGRIYPVTAISDIRKLDDKTGRIQVAVDGSPRWFGIKFFRLQVQSGALGLDTEVRLTKSSADVVEVDVNALSTF